MNPLIVANWKCNPKSLKEAEELLNHIKEGIGSNVVICPPSVFLSSLIKEKNISFGAQNCFYKEGAFTGENSVSMLEDLGVKYVILGHSERRNVFKETNEEINLKLKRVLESTIIPILCIGEKNEDREGGRTFEVLGEQLEKCLKDIPNIENIILAYEPVWAIGTGKSAQVSDIKEVRGFLKKKVPDSVKILYGGSVDSNNVYSYIAEAQMDGVLVGGVSLKPEEFLKLIKSARAE